jgi:predicted DNA-binding transcriptional regulator YafY
MPEIIQKLKEYDISAERKTLYSDFAELKHFGLDIISEKSGRHTYYHLGSRLFELAELKLLVDSVQAAKFITDRKSRTLISKLEKLTSRYQAGQLQHQVFIAGRVKTDNEKIYYNVDTINEAISSGRQISFHYFQWNVRKEPVLRHDGALYCVSPWGLMWDDEYYYMVAYDDAAGQIRHYRVDKMLGLSITDLPREGREEFSRFDMARYSKSLFGMYGGEESVVSIRGRNDMAAPLIDRFGRDLILIPDGPDHFIAHVRVFVSRQFLAWVLALGDGVRITGPEKVVQQVQDEIRRLNEQYM